MCDINRAKELLIKYNCTCVLCKGEHEYQSRMRGVKPLLEFLESQTDFKDFSAADKVVGAGAAHIYVLLKVKCVWAKVISSSAKKILEENGISVLCESEVPHIVNRIGDGICPIEMCVKDIENSNEALIAIKEKLKELA